MRVSSHGDRSIYRTDLGTMRATWEIRSGIPRVLFINDHTSKRRAFRWPDEPMPACRTGHIAFGPEDYPTLAEAIVLLPEYETTLWEHVRAEYRAESSPTGVPACAAGRTLTEEEWGLIRERG